MLSIIISSYKPDYFSALEKNIAETCGVPYEIIKVDNPGIMGICEAYNNGAAKAGYEYLLFLHEDVEFMHKNWGKFLTKTYFALPKVGVIGIAGASRKFKMAYGYGFSKIFLDEIFVNVGDENGKFYHKENNLPTKIKVIDGVFMAVKKDIWQEFKFNSKFLRGFHFYDIDFSLRISEKYQNYLIPNIGLIHFSKGKFGNDWVKEAIRFNKKSNYNFDPITETEKKQVRKDWYQRLKNEPISFTNRLRYILALGTDRFSRQAMQEFLFSKSR